MQKRRHFKLTQKHTNTQKTQNRKHWLANTIGIPSITNTEQSKNCSHLRSYTCSCAQLSYTTQHGAVLIIFPLNLQAVKFLFVSPF